MTTVILGSNRLEDCDHLITVGDAPLLSVGIREGRPLVSMLLSAAQYGTAIQVRDNAVWEGSLVVEQEEEGSVRIVQDRVTVVCARAAGDNGVEVEIDFRHLNLNIYSDAKALHVGGARLSGNVFRKCKTAIAIE